MRAIYLFAFFLFTSVTAHSLDDTTKVPKVPLYRQHFHDKIDDLQKLCDKADGKSDHIMHISGNEEINLQVTDALFRKIDELQNWIELNNRISNNNEKIRNLRYVENLLSYFRMNWKTRQIKPVFFPALLDNFDKIIKALAEGESILPYLNNTSYEIARINAEVFEDTREGKEGKNIVYLKFCSLFPDKILQTIRPYAKESFADSLITVACQSNPVQLYSYAQSNSSIEGQLIRRNTNSMVKAVSQLSQTANALFYFPFLDDILKGKKTIEDIRVFVGNGDAGYDSVGYYRLLVKTAIEYYTRMAPPTRDTPVAMFGANGLQEVLKAKAIRHFITPINELHNQNNLAIRMRAIDPLSPQELYYMMVMGENDIYTSSYKHSFNRLMQRMNYPPRGDSLLQSVHFDHFRKFIKMAANFNKLDTFLRTMPVAKSEVLMKAFVANLDRSGNLEDAVDVADAYSSITDDKLLKTILSYVVENETKAISDNNKRGKVIYGLLKTIFLSADSSNNIDLTGILGIPSIYEVQNKELQDDSGRIIQQVFFYGDEDGKGIFPSFLNSFSPKEWSINMKKEWVEIKSLKGKVWVFANRPLDYDANLDDSAQAHLNRYLEANNFQPSVAVHRGHSYWLPGTIKRMPSDCRIVVIGSCGGYQNLSQIIQVSPDAHIISTKEIGTGEINRPILNYLNQVFLSGNTLVWKNMWATLSGVFAKDPVKELRESWQDYIPPYKNLGAIFIKAYNKRMEAE